MTRKLFWTIAIVFLCGGAWAAEDKLAKLAAALDMTGQKGVELVSFSKRVYTVIFDKDWGEYDYDYPVDMNGYYVYDAPKYKETSNTGWDVQSKTENNTSPLVGGSCLVSTLPTELKKSSDAQDARIVFKVYGPGTFSFFYKTSCDPSDGLSVYVDGAIYSFDASGYGSNEDYDWVYKVDARTGEEKEVVNRAEIEIDGGVALTGPYVNTNKFWHEIVIVFTKDLPKTDWEGNYVPDGPEKPDKSWYEGDSEGYKEAMNEYEAEKALLKNRVWLDCVRWTPEELRFSLKKHEGVYYDEAVIVPETNALDKGYMVKYTLDGSAPTASSLSYDGTDDLELMVPCTVKMAVFYRDVLDINNNGNKTEILQDTTVGVLTQEVVIQASTPVLKVDKTASTETQIVLKPTEEYYSDNTLVYTTDGTEPTAESTVGDPEMGITVTDECTVIARCVREGILDSDTFSFTVRKLQPPVFRLLNTAGKEEPNGVTTDNSLTLEVENPSSALKYGMSVGAITTAYTEPIIVNVGTSCYLRCVEEGSLPSEIVSVDVKKVDKNVVFGQGDYALEVGWNLVSFPMAMTNDSIQNLVSRLCLFGFDAEARCYFRATIVKPGCAYWVYVGSPADVVSIALSGCQSVAAEPLKSGWNLLGLVNGQTTFGGKECWGFSNGAYTLLKGTQKPSLWKGYMVKD